MVKLRVVITTLYVFLGYHLENAVGLDRVCTNDITCIYPGSLAKACFCGCPIATVNRDFLKVNFTACADVLRECPFYELWLHIQFLNEEGEYISSNNIYLKDTLNKTYQIFSLSEVTNKFSADDPLYTHQHGLQLAFEKKYTVLIQPHCTICDESCNFMEDTEIPAVKYKELTQNIDPTGSKYPLIFILTVCFVLALSVLGLFSCRRRRMKRSSEPHICKELHPINVNRDILTLTNVTINSTHEV